MGGEGMRLRELPAGFQFNRRQAVGRIAINLVGAAKDEYRLRAVVARRLEQAESGAGVYPKIGDRLARRPIMRGLRGGMDDELDRRAVSREQLCDGVGIADIGFHVRVVLKPLQFGPIEARARIRAKKAAAHIVVDSNDVEPLGRTKSRGLRADQSARAGDNRDSHPLYSSKACARCHTTSQQVPPPLRAANGVRIIRQIPSAAEILADLRVWRTRHRFRNRPPRP